MSILVWVIQSCAAFVIPNGLNDAYIGMTTEQLKSMSKNRASLEIINPTGEKIYSFKWGTPGSQYLNRTTFYYFYKDSLFKIDAGEYSGPPPQVRFNYNLK